MSILISIVSVIVCFLLMCASGVLEDTVMIVSNLVSMMINVILFFCAIDGINTTKWSLLILAISLLIVISRYSSAKERCEAINAEEERNKKIAFYEYCEENGINNCTSEKNKAKIQLIIDERKLNAGEDMTAFFEECKQLKKERDDKKEKERIAAIVKEERQQKESLEKYYSFIGRDKRVAIFSEERFFHLQKAGLVKAGQEQLIRDSQQRESDWAIHGGIASGIAGGAAGVATAMDIQAKNASIRAQNDANLMALAPVVLAGIEEVEYHKKEAETLAEKISEAKTKLISDMSAEELFEKLVVTSKRLSVSDSGTVTVNMWISKPEELMIFDDVPAIIDGTIIANIFDGEEKIGSCYMVLPTYGVDKKKEKITGMCLTCGKKGEKYTVEFEALHLWAMER